MGLVSFLKEERNCKIAILLNEERMSDDARNEFRAQLEKVVDVSLLFDPDVLEAVQIAFPENDDIQISLAVYIKRLKITNIRVIKKIERSARQLREILKDAPQPVRDQAFQTLVLASWSVFQPNEAPLIEYVKRFNAVTRRTGQGTEKETSQQQAWALTLHSYNFTMSDDFDEEIIKGVERGYFDRTKLEELSNKQAASFDSSGERSSFSAAWQKYHSSLSSNDEEVLNEIFAGALKDISTISPLNIDATIRLFREVGDNERADGLVEAYIKGRDDHRSFFDLRSYPFRDDISDPGLIGAFKAKYEEEKDTRAPIEVLQKVANGGYDNEDTDYLAELTVDDFRDVFEKLNGEALPKVVKAAIALGVPSKTNGRTVASLAQEALISIGKKSPLNRRRIEGYGITVAD